MVAASSPSTSLPLMSLVLPARWAEKLVSVHSNNDAERASRVRERHIGPSLSFRRQLGMCRLPLPNSGLGGGPGRAVATLRPALLAEPLELTLDDRPLLWAGGRVRAPFHVRV